MYLVSNELPTDYLQRNFVVEKPSRHLLHQVVQGSIMDNGQTMGDLMGLAEDAAPLHSSQQKDVYRESNHKETSGKSSKSRDILQNSQTLPKGQGHIKGDKRHGNSLQCCRVLDGVLAGWVCHKGGYRDSC